MEEICSAILEIQTEDGIFYSPISVDVFEIYNDIKIQEVSYNGKPHRIGDTITIRYRDLKWAIKKSGTIKEFIFDKEHNCLMASVKETSLHIDIVNNMEVVCLLDNKLVKHNSKLWAISRRDKNKIDSFTIDCEYPSMYHRYFDTTKEKNDFYLFWTEEEAKNFILENAQCISLKDILSDLDNILDDSGIEDEKIRDTLKHNIYKKMSDIPYRRCDGLKEKEKKVVSTHVYEKMV